MIRIFALLFTVLSTISTNAVATTLNEKSGDVRVVFDDVVNKAMLIQIRADAAREMYARLNVAETTNPANPALGKFKMGKNVICYLGDGTNTVCTMDLSFKGEARAL